MLQVSKPIRQIMKFSGKIREYELTRCTSREQIPIPSQAAELQIDNVVQLRD